ncbi:MAG: hypothetical protein AB7V08_15040 [Elusimicrobiales bacterium]
MPRKSKKSRAKAKKLKTEKRPPYIWTIKDMRDCCIHCWPSSSPDDREPPITRPVYWEVRPGKPLFPDFPVAFPVVVALYICPNPECGKPWICYHDTSRVFFLLDKCEVVVAAPVVPRDEAALYADLLHKIEALYARRAAASRS